MATIIYTRHALKEYNNGKAPKGYPMHDPSIKEGEEERINKKSQELRQKYGDPNRIFCSPYKRTRLTTEILKKDLQVNPIVDSLVGEFLGHQKPINGCRNPDVTPTTGSYPLPLLGETTDQLKLRCRTHLDKMGFCNRNVAPGVTWVISHGFVIETIVEKLKQWGSEVHIPQQLDLEELDSIVIEYNSEVPIVTYLKAPK